MHTRKHAWNNGVAATAHEARLEARNLLRDPSLNSLQTGRESPSVPAAQLLVLEERRISTEQPQPTAAHHTITTARRPDHICLSALVRSRSTQFIVHASSQLGRGPPKRGHFSAILAGFFRGCASQKCSNHRKRFILFAEHAEKIPSILLFWLSNRLLTKPMYHILSRFLVNPFPALWSTWNMGFKWSCQQIELKTYKRHLPILKISWPSYPPKTVIYPSKTVDVDHILFMTRIVLVYKPVVEWSSVELAFIPWQDHNFVIYTPILTISKWKVLHQPGASPYPSCLYMYVPVLLHLWGSCMSVYILFACQIWILPSNLNCFGVQTGSWTGVL